MPTRQPTAALFHGGMNKSTYSHRLPFSIFKHVTSYYIERAYPRKIPPKSRFSTHESSDKRFKLHTVFLSEIQYCRAVKLNEVRAFSWLCMDSAEAEFEVKYVTHASMSPACLALLAERQLLLPPQSYYRQPAKPSVDDK